MCLWRRVSPFACTLFLAVLAGPSASGADTAIKAMDGEYLSGRGVSVMLSNDIYNPIFFDQKNSAMQIILHDERIATNGSVRLAPTPEKWGSIPHLDSHGADRVPTSLRAWATPPAWRSSARNVLSP